jgi:hypothetical protein
MISTASYVVIGGDYSISNYTPEDPILEPISVSRDPTLKWNSSRTVDYIVEKIDTLRNILHEDGPPVIIDGRTFPEGRNGFVQFRGVVALTADSKGNVLYTCSRPSDYQSECSTRRITLDKSLCDMATENWSIGGHQKNVETLKGIIEKEAGVEIDPVLIVELLKMYEVTPNPQPEADLELAVRKA